MFGYGKCKQNKGKSQGILSQTKQADPSWGNLECGAKPEPGFDETESSWGKPIQDGAKPSLTEPMSNQVIWKPSLQGSKSIQEYPGGDWDDRSWNRTENRQENWNQFKLPPRGSGLSLAKLSQNWKKLWRFKLHDCKPSRGNLIRAKSRGAGMNCAVIRCYFSAVSCQLSQLFLFLSSWSFHIVVVILCCPWLKNKVTYCCWLLDVCQLSVATIVIVLSLLLLKNCCPHIMCCPWLEILSSHVCNIIFIEPSQREHGRMWWQNKIVISCQFSQMFVVVVIDVLYCCCSFCFVPC